MVCLLLIRNTYSEVVAIATATTATIYKQSNCKCDVSYRKYDVTSVCCEAPCQFHALIIMLPVYRSCKCLLNLIHISQWGHIIAKNVARCRDVVKYVSNVP